MEQLIPLNQADDGETLVNLRDLHSFLQVKSEFNKWVKRRIKQYEFEEGRDYRSSKVANVDHGAVNTWSIEYSATISMAKQLTMVENNARGKQARQYFIAVEEQFKRERQEAPKLSQAELLLESAKILLDHDSRLRQIERELVNQKSEAEKAKEFALALPKPNVELQQASTRQLLNERINYYVASTSYKVTHQEAWRILYQKAVYRLGIHFNLIGNKLDQVEKKGKLDLLYALACELFPLERQGS